MSIKEGTEYEESKEGSTMNIPIPGRSRTLAKMMLMTMVTENTPAVLEARGM
jgi:hypothetical protein